MSSRRSRSGRHPDVDAAQAVEQIGPEQLTLDHRRQTAVGGGHDADVHPARAVAADALDGQILNGPQQLGLRGERQIGHLVEKQRAAVGVLELAAAPADAGRRPLFDAEELGLEQRLDERGAVDGDKRTVAPPAQLVELARHQLLADAALALQQHREVGRGHALEPGTERLHRRRRSDERRGAIAFRPDALQKAGSRQLRPAALDFQDERADVRRVAEQLKIPLAERRARIEGRLEHPACPEARHRERNRLDHVGAAVRTGPPAVGVAQMDGAHRHHAPQHLFERASHQRDVGALTDRARERGRARPRARFCDRVACGVNDGPALDVMRWLRNGVGIGESKEMPPEQVKNSGALRP